MAAKNEIVVVGSANIDLVVKSSQLPRPGETVLGGKFYSVPGGKGANQAVAAARAGGKVAFIGRVGADDFGDRLRKNLEKEKIDTTFLLSTPEEPTGVALINVGPNGENAITVAPGANSALTPEDIKKARTLISRAGILLLQLEIPIATVVEAIEIAHGSSTKVILNPAPAASLSKDILKKVFLLTPNEIEAGNLAGIEVENVRTALRAGKILVSLGTSNVIITLGSKGALAVSEGWSRYFPAFRVKPVDTTAAGDVFSGALAVAINEGKTVGEAVVFANAASALSVTRPGAQSSCPSRAEIETMLRTLTPGKSRSKPIVNRP